MKKIITFFFLYPIILFSQNNKVDYDIYSFLINKTINEFPIENIKLVVINDSLIEDINLLDMQHYRSSFKIDDNNSLFNTVFDFPKQSELDSLWDIIVTKAEFIVGNKLESSSFKVNKPIQLIDYTHRTKLKKSKDYWKQFYRLYPNSLGQFKFSPVFRSGRLAAVFMEHHLGFLSGTGYLMIMSKKDDGWEVCIPIMLWIS